MSADEKKRIEAVALAVPVSLVERCHAHVLAIKTFLPSCNPNITSDAKVGIHQLAGAARAAYQTALVNSPPPDVRERLRALLQELRAIEDGWVMASVNQSFTSQAVSAVAAHPVVSAVVAAAIAGVLARYAKDS